MFVGLSLWTLPKEREMDWRRLGVEGLSAELGDMEVS